MCYGCNYVSGQRYINCKRKKKKKKRDMHQSIVTNWIRTRINICLLRSTPVCIRGSRSYKIDHDPINDIDIKLATVASEI